MVGPILTAWLAALLPVLPATVEVRRFAAPEAHRKRTGSAPGRRHR